MGSGERAPPSLGGGLAEPPDGGHLPLAASRGPRGGRAREDRPPARSLLLRHQAHLAPRAGEGPAAARRGRRRPVRHRRLLASLEAHRRPRPRHGRHQRLAHPAVRHSRAPLAPRPALPLRGAGGHASAGGAKRRRVRRDLGGRPAARRHPRGRRGGGPAGRALRSGLLGGRNGQEHLRHGLFPHDEDGRRAPIRGRRPPGHALLRSGRPPGLRPGRLRLHRRGRRPVVARRARLGGGRRGDGGCGPRHPRHHGRLRGARVCRARRALLGHGRARGRGGADPRRGPPADRARHPGEHRLPDARRGGRHEPPFRDAAAAAARGWRSDGQRLPHAVPGRPPGPAGATAGAPGDHRRRRRLPGRTRRRALEGR